MSHVTPGELIEAADGTLDPARRRHLESCAECARAVVALEGAMREMRHAGDVPEPSPLFWDHLSERVRAATRGASVPARPGWRDAMWRPALVGMTALVVAMLIGRLSAPADNGAAPGGRDIVLSAPERVVAGGAEPSSGEPVAGSPSPAAGAASTRPPEPAGEAWAAVTKLAGTLDADAVRDLASAPVSTGTLVDELSQRELEEFARLLRAEMRGMQ